MLKRFARKDALYAWDKLLDMKTKSSLKQTRHFRQFSNAVETYKSGLPYL